MGIHIIESFISCIVKVMEGSDLKVYVTAAYGNLNDIFNSKSCVKVPITMLHHHIRKGSLQQDQSHLKQ